MEHGEQSVTFSLGGPITELGNVYVPLPLIGLGYNVGLIDNKLDIEVGLNVTEILYGIFNLETGANWRPFLSKGWRPGLIVTPRFFFFTNFLPSSFKFYPDFALTFPWEVRENWFAYTGIENFFELSKVRYDGNPQKHHWFVVPYLGWSMGNKKWQFQWEWRVYVPNLVNTGKPTKNKGFGDRGIHGVFLGVSRVFGGREK